MYIYFICDTFNKFLIVYKEAFTIQETSYHTSTRIYKKNQQINKITV